MGLATGLMFMHPLSAFLGPTTVTWDASTCPAGSYSITATARATSDTKFYSVTTSNVSLPRASVVQQFQDLPSGSYQVSAVAMANSGKSFQSQLQTVTGSGSSSGGGVIFGRSRPPTSPAIGLARSRNQPVDPPKPPPTDKRQAPAAAAPATDPSPPRSGMAFEGHARRVLALLATQLDGTDRQWLRISVVDDDEDGSIDYIAVEHASGEIWIYRFQGS